jgi:anti-sigma B factor antagonist
VEITADIDDKILWVKIGGRMVMDPSLFRLREHVHYALDTGIRYFAVDLSAVTYLDSAGCGEVISAHTSIQRAKGALAFINPSERVRVVWATTHLNKVLNIFDSVEQARAFLQ